MSESDETAWDVNTASTRGPRAGRWSLEQRQHVAQRRALAIELRIAGATYESIAQTLGYRSRANVATDIHRALREVIAVPAQELRELELRRLDALQAGHWLAAKAGDPKAANVVLKIMERRHKLLGLDAPAKVDIDAFLRGLAEREGLPYDFVVRVANDVVRAAGF